MTAVTRCFIYFILVALPLLAAAQDYPNKPIRMIVPLAPARAAAVISVQTSSRNRLLTVTLCCWRAYRRR